MRKLSKKHSLSVLVKMPFEAEARRLLSLIINRSDGGIIVTPRMDPGVASTCAALHVPLEGGLAQVEGTKVGVAPGARAKLHYHLSGMTSVQEETREGGDGRVTVHLPSLKGLDCQQIFSVVARVPGHLPTMESARRNDIMNIVTERGVASLYLAGVVYDRSKIRKSNIGGFEEGNPVSFSTESSAATIIDLSGYGLEAVLAIFSTPVIGRLPSGVSSFSLCGYIPADVHDKGGVAIYATDGYPLPYLMQNIPTFEYLHNAETLDPRVTVFSKSIEVEEFLNSWGESGASAFYDQRKSPGYVRLRPTRH